MKYIFWNVHKEPNANNYIYKLITQYHPDIVGIAEYGTQGKILESQLQNDGMEYSYIPKIGSRLDLFYRGSASVIKHAAETKYYTVKLLPFGRQHQILVIVHLPSKLYKNNYDNFDILHEMLEDIDREKEKKKIENVVIMGDFNMNPFEDPMIAATALQAVPSREIAKKGSRIYMDKERIYYYNPMWNFLGDEKCPMGTYYYQSPRNQALFWNTFDQFVVSSVLVDRVNTEHIKIINKIGNVSLAKDSGIPKTSDHFPVYFEIEEI